MESDYALRVRWGFSIGLGTGLPLPLAQRGNLLTVDSRRQSLSTIERFQLCSGEAAANLCFKRKPRFFVAYAPQNDREIFIVILSASEGSVF